MNGNEMNTHDDLPKASVPTEGAGRRRFVRGVGAAVPVALTVSARSAMACHCNAVSAHASINLTHSHNSTLDQNIALSNTLNPSALASKPVSYFTGIGANGNFATYFGSGPNLTMRNVLLPSSGASVFAKQIAAAYVNFKKDPSVSKCYSLQQLKDMWTYGPTSTYQPVPNANWGVDQIGTYLIGTWT
jgi:hypothetical protein